MSGANTALEAEQLELAKQWRDRITDEIDTYGPTYKARLDYLFGRLYRMELDLDNAVASFQTAKDSGDLYSSVRAEYELTDLNLQQETIELGNIQRLERLRYTTAGRRIRAEGFEPARRALSGEKRLS